MITNHRFFNFSFSLGLVINAFSAGAAKNVHLSSNQFILALYRASVIASSTISIHTNLSHLPCLSNDIHIVHAPQ